MGQLRDTVGLHEKVKDVGQPQAQKNTVFSVAQRAGGDGKTLRLGRKRKNVRKRGCMRADSRVIR